MKPTIILAAALALAGCNQNNQQKQIPIEDDAYFEQYSKPQEPSCAVNQWTAVEICRAGECEFMVRVNGAKTEESCWSLIDRSPDNIIPFCVPPYNPTKLRWCRDDESPYYGISIKP